MRETAGVTPEAGNFKSVKVHTGGAVVAVEEEEEAEEEDEVLAAAESLGTKGWPFKVNRIERAG